MSGKEPTLRIKMKQQKPLQKQRFSLTTIRYQIAKHKEEKAINPHNCLEY